MERRRVKKHWKLITTAVVATFVALAIAEPDEASAIPQPVDPITFDQRAFPCEEDEVLGFAPEFGPDRVGCIHIEDIER